MPPTPPEPIPAPKPTGPARDVTAIPLECPPSLRPHDAFFFLPQVDRILEWNRQNAMPEQGGGTVAPRYPSLEWEGCQCGLKPKVFFFYQPAQFPYPWFGPAGESLPLDGALIHEGMRFIATKDGQYEVRLTITTPGMPVTLRLQLLLSDNLQDAFTLTLPPINLYNPDKQFQGNYLGNSYQVRHAGFSPLVARYWDHLESFSLVRHGTARFGSWPEGIERYESLPTAPVLTTSPSVGGTAGPPSAPGAATPPPPPPAPAPAPVMDINGVP